MGDLGLQGSYGAAGGAQALRQMLLDREKQKQQQFENAQTLANSGRADRSLNQQDTLTRLKIQESADAKTAAEGDKQFTQSVTADNTIPAGTLLPQESPMTARLQMLGAVAPQPLQAEAPPASIAAPGQDQPSDVPNTVANAPRISGRLMVKQASEKQLQDKAANDKSATAADRQQAQLDELIRHNGAMEAKPTREPNPQPQMFIGPDGKTHAVQFVNGQAREIPMPADYRKPNGTLDNRLASATAVSQTGDDIIRQLSDPAFKTTVGPALGRFNTLRDFIGNPPPEFAQLAGEIESYALANMGVHGMRSAQGAEQIKKLLDQKHTPDSMIATIRGLNSFSQHFMQNNGGGTTTTPSTSAPAAMGGAPAAPTGWKYVPKPGGGWTAVEAK